MVDVAKSKGPPPEKLIRLATDLTFDESAATQTFGIVSRKGGGKTYLASKLVEELYGLHCPIVVIDPVGNWWGITVAANGKDKGLSCVVLGGERGDLELSPEGGAVVAEIVISRTLNVVLDVSSFSKANMRRFVADFCERFFELSKRKRQARMVVFEEAQRFAPQQFKGQERMLGAVEDIVRLGRNYGLGCVLISQRPQSVNKEVLSQVECLFAGQINESHARKALLAWIVEKDEDLKTRLNELASLGRGEFFCWSPSWLRIFQKVRILPKWTFDASSTPGISESEVVEPPVGRLSAGEIDALRAAMKGGAVEEKGRAGWGERMTDAVVDGLVEDIRRRDSVNAEVRKALSDMLEEVVGIKTRLMEEILPGLVGIIQMLSANDRGPRPIVTEEPAPARAPEAVSLTPGESLSKCAKAVLTVLVQQGKPLTKPRLALMAGYSANSGGFNSSLAELRTKGLMDGRGGFSATRVGIEALGPVPRLPSGKALYEYWLRHPRLDKCSRAILEGLRGKAALHKTEIARATGYSANSGGFNNALARLRTLGLIEGHGGVANLVADLRGT